MPLDGWLLHAAQCVWCWWDPWCTKSDWVTKHLTDVDNLLKYMEVMWCRSLMIIMGVNYGSFFNGMWGSFLALHFTLSLMSTALICLSTKSLSKGTWPWRWLRLQCQIANWFALFRAQHSTAQYSMDEYSNHGVMMILSGQGVFLRRLSRLSLSTQGLFELTPLQCMSLKIKFILYILWGLNLIIQDLQHI